MKKNVQSHPVWLSGHTSTIFFKQNAI